MSRTPRHIVVSKYGNSARLVLEEIADGDILIADEMRRGTAWIPNTAGGRIWISLDTARDLHDALGRLIGGGE
jgi:hypothetical protein